jgi:predicted PhzF superfamily epimerase YddE/YHI9
MGLTITQVDAFTETPFAGNPAPVCLLPAPRDVGWMHGPFWQARLGKSDLLAYQASPRGGGVRVVGDRVKLGGKAVTVLRGELIAL